MNPLRVSILSIALFGTIFTGLLFGLYSQQTISPDRDLSSAQINGERLETYIGERLSTINNALNTLSYNSYWQSSPVAEWSFWLDSQKQLYSAAGLSKMGVHARSNDVMYLDKPSLPGQYSELQGLLERLYQNQAPVEVLQQYRGKPAILAAFPIKSIDKQVIGALVGIKYLDNEALKAYHLYARVPVALVQNEKILAVSIDTSPAINNYQLVDVKWPKSINSALWKLVLLVKPAPAVSPTLVISGIGVLLTLILSFIIRKQFNAAQAAPRQLAASMDINLPVAEQINQLTTLQAECHDETMVGLIRAIRQRLEKQVKQKRSLTIEMRKLQQSENELKRKNQALEDQRDSAFNAPKLKSEFLSRMGDEITTPMKSVVSMLKLLSEYDFDAEPKQLLNIAKRSTRTLVDNLNNILDFSKLDAGMLKLVEKPFSTRELLDDLTSEVSHFANDKGLSLQISSDPEVPDRITSDVVRVKQVLRNILGNAIRFTKQGEVSLYADVVEQESGDMLRFTIKDTGVGIPLDAQKGLFDSMEQNTKLTNSSFAGRLRLIVSQRISELMGGEIGVISEPGKGSQFWFTIAL